MDKVRIIRSKADNTKTKKLECMEWMARYTEFIPADNIRLAASELKKEYMTNVPTEVRDQLRLQ